MNRITVIATLLIFIPTFSSCSDNAIKYYNKGVKAAAEDDMENAIRFWEKSLSYREDPDAYYNLGSAHLIREDYEEAIENLSKSIELRSGDHTAHYKLGYAFQHKGDIPLAKKNYKFAIELKQNYLPPYIGMAECALMQNNLMTAEKYSSAALLLSPDNEKANLLFAETLYRSDKYSDAYLHLLPLRSTTNEKLLLLLGKVMYKRRMYIDAYETLSDARELGETGDEIFYFLGLSSLRLKRNIEAENFFKLALFKNDRHCGAISGLAEVHLENGEFDEAQKAYKQAEKCNPDSPQIKGDFGTFLWRIGDFTRAASKLEYAVKNMDNPGRYLFYLGSAYIENGQNAEAAEVLSKFVETWRGEEQIVERARELLDGLE